MSNTFGRKPVGINQPPGGGTNYPFVMPSADVQYLLGDFYLSYEDNLCQFDLPFSVAWLYGFGDQVVSVPPDVPTPVHALELLIVDANNSIVFDSTLATTFRSKAWSDRLLIVEWISDVTVCRATVHTAWSQADIDQGYSKTYDVHIVPTDGRLDTRTINRMPVRLRSLRVGPKTLTGSRVVLDSGYNVALSVVPDTDDYSDLSLDLADVIAVEKSVVDAKRLTTRLQIQANPGDGMGQKPGCEDTVVTLKSLGGAKPTDYGNLNIDMSGCLRLQRPVVLDSLSPRTFVYGAEGMTATEAQSTLAMHNDCGPCCDCNLFARVHKGLRRQWLLWEDLASRTQQVCEMQDANVDRWHASKTCRGLNTIRTLLMPEKGCKVTAGASYCNNHKCCATPLTMRFSFQFYRDGVLTEVIPSDCQNAVASGSSFGVETSRIAMSGAWPVFEYSFDYANPTEMSKVGFRIGLPQCQVGDSMRMFVSVHYPEFDTTPDGVSCETAVGDVPSELQSIWDAMDWQPNYPARAIQLSPLVPLDNTNPYCAACVVDWKPPSGSQSE